MKRIAVWFIAADGPVAATAQKMIESYFFGVSRRQLKIPPTIRCELPFTKL
jgi:hypothetical protein